MAADREKFFIEREMAWEPIGQGLTRQIMGTDNQIMLVKVHFESGAVGARHNHFHTQTSYVVSGKFSVEIEGEKIEAVAGDGFYVAPNLMHQVICIDAGTVIDVFSPVREDFLG